MASTSPLLANVYPPEAHLFNTALDVSGLKIISRQKAVDWLRPIHFKPSLLLTNQSSTIRKYHTIRVTREASGGD
jgi:hypothetical protein